MNFGIGDQFSNLCKRNDKLSSHFLVLLKTRPVSYLSSI